MEPLQQATVNLFLASRPLPDKGPLRDVDAIPCTLRAATIFVQLDCQVLAKGNIAEDSAAGRDPGDQDWIADAGTFLWADLE